MFIFFVAAKPRFVAAKPLAKPKKSSPKTFKKVVLEALRSAIAEALQSPMEEEVGKYVLRRSRKLGSRARHVIAEGMAEEMAEGLAEEVAANLPRRLQRRVSDIVSDDVEEFWQSRGFRAMMRSFMRCQECQLDSSSSEAEGVYN